jgi:hypothetical protein
MARSLSLALALLPFVTVGPVAFVACVGDDPVGTPTTDSGTAPTGTTTSTGSTTSTPDSSTPPPVDASTNETSTVDAADAAPALHYVFVTSASVNGGFAAGIPAGQTPWTVADDRCRIEATAANLPGKFVAWLSYTDGAGTKFNAAGRIADWAYHMPGTLDGSKPPVLITPNRADLISKGPLVQMDRLANGMQAPQDENSAVTYVWTGSNGDGTAALSDCNAWTNANASQSGGAGNARRIPSFTATDWTSFGGRTCDARRRFYCFQIP